MAAELPMRGAAEDIEHPGVRVWRSPPGLAGWFAAVQNNTIGTRYIITALIFLLIGGIQSLIMRVQLARADQDIISAEAYNQLFTMHGTTMMFLFAVPIVEAFATYFIPSMIGARDLPFPRLTAMGYWIYVLGGVIFQMSFFIGAAPDGGWFAYTPLTGPAYSTGVNIDFWLLGLGVIEVSAMAAAIELIVGILKTRSPGMSLNRMPLFAWSILVMAFMILFAFPAVIAASALLELDRALSTQFFNPDLGGDPLLWQHLFWIFGHPEVYIMFLPAAGMISMIVATFCRRPLAGYTLVVAATVLIGFLSFGLWVHHMFATGIPFIALSFFTGASLVIAVGSGIQVFAWLATIWHGRILWRTPFIFAVGFLANFVLGGITGVMVAIAPFDWQVHDSYFVVAHFHYVLIGGVVFPIFAGIYYWFPKMTGRMLSERLGIVSFALMFVGFNLTFFPMHITGIMGMPRRVYTYESGVGWELLNFMSSVGAAILAVGVLVTLWNAARSLRTGREAGDNPWQAGTLEWAVASPTPNFTPVIPVTSREPLWSAPPRNAAGEPAYSPEVQALVEDQDRVHDDLREGFVTSILEARPVAIMHIAGPSYWPLFVAFALTLTTVSAIIPQTEAKLFAIAVGATLTIGGIAGWLWPSQEEKRAWKAHEDENLHPLPTQVHGPASAHWWGMVFFLIAQGTIIAFFVYSYYYLLSNNATWPPSAFGQPDVALMALATGLLFVASGAAFVAERSIARGKNRLMAFALGVASVLSLAYVVLAAVELAGLDFSHDTHAYGSIFYVLLVITLLEALLTVVIGGVLQLRNALQHFTPRRYIAVQNLALFTYFTAALALVTFVTLYVSPYVLERTG